VQLLVWYIKIIVPVKCIFVQESEQKYFCGWGFARILGGQLTALPRLPSWIKGLTSKGMGNL